MSQYDDTNYIYERVNLVIKKLKLKLKTSVGNGIFHDSRSDCNALAKVCNQLIAKVNELTDKVNELEKRQRGV